MENDAWINSCWFTVVFWVVGLGMSLFHGLCAVSIFNVKAPPKAGIWNFHQFWFNFCGSVSGWIALWFLLHKIALSLNAPAAASPKLSDIALFFLAFIGVTGYLPFSVITGVESFREIAAKIAGIGK
jgi:hypothetical protein